MNEDLFDELSDKLSDIEEKLDSLAGGIEELISDAVEDAVESTVEDAVENAMLDAVNTSRAQEKSVLYIFSQDKKLLAPFISAEAVRSKKGEESYGISVYYGNSCRCFGKYENKEAALLEMGNIAKAIREGKNIYEMR